MAVATILKLRLPRDFPEVERGLGDLKEAGSG
jgi:hypothetical protein